MAQSNMTSDDLKRFGFVEDPNKPGEWIRTPIKKPIVINEKPIEAKDKYINIYTRPPLIVFDVDPIGKPRMTQQDKWKKRPATDRYWEMKDRLKLIAKGSNFVMPDSYYHMIFYMPMPDSWSKKKKEEMNGKSHQTKPDVDNLTKAIFDALCEEDSHIWDGRQTKLWAYKGRIVIHKL